MTTLKIFISILVVGLIVDYLWIGVLAKNFYLSAFGDLAQKKTDGSLDVVLWAGLAVYLLIVIGIVFFALPKISPSDSLFITFGWGALLGFIVYGVYDFTNHATLVRWPLSLVFLDLAWGAFFVGAMTTFGKILRDHYFMS